MLPPYWGNLAPVVAMQKMLHTIIWLPLIMIWMQRSPLHGPDINKKLTSIFNKMYQKNSQDPLPSFKFHGSAPGKLAGYFLALLAMATIRHVQLLQDLFRTVTAWIHVQRRIWMIVLSSETVIPPVPPSLQMLTFIYQ